MKMKCRTHGESYEPSCMACQLAASVIQDRDRTRRRELEGAAAEVTFRLRELRRRNLLRWDLLKATPHHLLDSVLISMCERKVPSLESEVKEIHYPATWWQAFRARWLPRWWLRWFPVRETVHRLRAVALFPEMKRLVRGDETWLKVALPFTEEHSGRPETRLETVDPADPHACEACSTRAEWIVLSKMTPQRDRQTCARHLSEMVEIELGKFRREIEGGSSAHVVPSCEVVAWE